MTDITEVQSEIKAVKFALDSFADYENEQKRKDFLRQNFHEVPGLKTYFGFSLDELKHALNLLFSCLNNCASAQPPQQQQLRGNGYCMVEA